MSLVTFNHTLNSTEVYVFVGFFWVVLWYLITCIFIECSDVVVWNFFIRMSLLNLIFQILSHRFASWIITLQRHFQLVGSHMFGHIFSFSQIPFADGALKDKDVKEDHLLTKSLTLFFLFSLLAGHTTFLFPLTSFSHAWVGKIIRLPVALLSSSVLAHYRL